LAKGLVTVPHFSHLSEIRLFRSRFHGLEEWEPPRREGRQGRNAKAGINFLLPGNGKRKTALTKTFT
jgi:hypothetical protein